MDVKRRIVWLAPSHRRKNSGVRRRYRDLASWARRNARRQSCGAARACQKPPHRRRKRAIRVAFVRARRARGDCQGARFGVAVWTAASLGALEIEMLNGLVRDLNETTRFSTLPLAAAGQWRGCARRLRMDNRLPDANRIRRRRARSMIPGVSTPSDSSRQGKPIACCGSPPSGRPRRHGRTR